MDNCRSHYKYSIIAAVAICLITLVVCIAMFLPKNVGNTLEEIGEASSVFKASEIETKINCSLDDSGKYTIDAGDPQLILSLDGQNVECVKLNITSPVKKAVNFEVYTAFDDSAFSAERCYAGCILPGETNAIVDVPQGEYWVLRVDIDDDNIYLKNVEVYADQPKLVPYKPNYSVWDYIFVICIPIIMAAAAWFANAKTGFCQKLFEKIKQNKLKIATFIVFSILALLIGVLVEMLFGGPFNVYRWVFFAGIAELIVVFVLGFKNLKEKPENVFLPLVLVLGLVMLFSSPIKHICWDLDSHYPWAVQNSYLGTAYFTGADVCIDNTAQQSLMGADFGLETYKNDIEYLNASDKIFVKQIAPEFLISHLPAGIFIAIARMFGASFTIKYNIGRMAYLLLYALVCYFAIKKIKSGKMILATICLFPTCLFMATNYAYDSWVIAFSILGVSYYVSEIQEPQKPITIKDTIIMCGSFALASAPKLVYVVMMCIPLFMIKKWNNKKELRRYYLILITLFAIVFAFFMLRSLNAISGSGDSRGGDVNPPGQIALIFSNPLGYAKTLTKFLSGYLSIGTMQQYISHFAYLGIGRGWQIFVVLIGFTTLTDSNANIKFKIPIIIRFCAILLFVGLSALIATALYIDFTPVGADTILGCQPRYIIPMLSPLLLLLAGQRINCIKNKSVYNGIVLILCSIGVMSDIYSQILIKMV